MKTLSKPNSGLKSELIFPPEVVGKLSLAFQIPNLKRSHVLWNWRRITDVDFCVRFGGYGELQIYSLRTFEFYCRLSHLLTFGWLLVEHLRTEVDPEHGVMAAASLGSPWAWLRPTWRGAGTAALAGCLGTPGVPHFCLPSAGVAKLLPSPQSSSFPFLALPCLAEEAKSVTTELHPPAACAGTGTGKGKGCSGSARRAAFLEAGCFPGSTLLPLEVCARRWELPSLLFLHPPPRCKTCGWMSWSLLSWCWNEFGTNVAIPRVKKCHLNL